MESEPTYVKPKCPSCGRTHVRYRVRPEFAKKPFLCNLCGCEFNIGKK